MQGEEPFRTGLGRKKARRQSRRAGGAERTQTLRMMPMGVDSLDWPRGLSPRILAI